MIKWENGKIQIACDQPNCDCVLDTEQTTFGRARDVYVDEGWEVVRHSFDVWEHFCPDCLEKTELSVELEKHTAND